MSKPIKPMTKEDLSKQVSIPEVYKKAIEHAIDEMTDREDPEDQNWPDYFRGEVVATEVGSVLNDNDELDDHFYTTEAGWFQAGWKAREHVENSKKGSRATILREMAGWLMGRYLVKTGDHYKIEVKHTRRMRDGLPPWEES